MISFLYRIFKFLKHPRFLGVGLLLLSLYLAFNHGTLTQEPKPNLEAALVALDDMAAMNPNIEGVLVRLENEHEKFGMLAAAGSTRENGQARSVLREMADEMVQQDGLPYRARLAALFHDDEKRFDQELQEAFFTTHGTVCESLRIAEKHFDGITHAYVTTLEQARQNSNVWPLVRDDPLGLIIWDEFTKFTQDDQSTLQALKFYHKNREWLADPLASLDLSQIAPGVNDWTIPEVINRLMQFEETLRLAIHEDEGDLGVYGLAVMLTHGQLVDECRKNYRLDPSETISVIFMNLNLLSDWDPQNENGQLILEGDSKWIHDKASWLAQIEKQSSTVWLSAGTSPFALKLHIDAPATATSILTKYTADAIPILIYQHFEDPGQVQAAAKAIDVYGEVAMYVFIKYEDDAFIKKLGKHLTDPEIGIRIIPFILMFGDEAFEKIAGDTEWLDKYINEDGTPRRKNWISFVPLVGGAGNVIQNWAQGHPNEWSEIGWAVWDVADAAIAVYTLGASKGVTTSAKAGALAGKTAIITGKGPTRAYLAGLWKKALTSPVGLRMSKVKVLSQAAKLVGGTLRAIKLTVWGSVRMIGAPARLAWQGVHKTFQTWKSLPPSVRKWTLRGLVATSVIIKFNIRTAPHIKEIARGISDLLANAIIGATEMAATTISNFSQKLLDELTGNNVSGIRSGALWLVVVLTVFFVVPFPCRRSFFHSPECCHPPGTVSIPLPSRLPLKKFPL